MHLHELFMNNWLISFKNVHDWIWTLELFMNILTQKMQTYQLYPLRNCSTIEVHMPYRSRLTKSQHTINTAPAVTAGVAHNFQMEKHYVKAYLQHVSNMSIRIAFVLLKCAAKQYIIPKYAVLDCSTVTTCFKYLFRTRLCCNLSCLNHKQCIRIEMFYIII